MGNGRDKKRYEEQIESLKEYAEENNIPWDDLKPRSIEDRWNDAGDVFKSVGNILDTEN